MTDDTQDIVARLRAALPMTTLYASEMWAPYKAADIIEEQAKEIERLGRELNRAKYGDPDFAWEAHQAALDAAQAEIEHLQLLLAQKAVAEMVQAGEEDGLLNEKRAGDE